MDIGADNWDSATIDRAVLNDSPQGQQIATAFIATFGEYVTTSVRPVLREVADDGGEPQLLVNGLASLLRQVADSIEFPVGSER